jgi:hypothetical protein
VSHKLKAGLSGRCYVHARDVTTGKLVMSAWNKNLIMDAGLVHVAELLGGYPRRPSHIALGTNDTAPAAGDTTLGTEVFRKIITRRRIPSAPNNYKIYFQLYLTTGEANGNTLVEAGILNRSALGTMLSHVIHDPIVKTSSISVMYTWEITVATV